MNEYTREEGGEEVQDGEGVKRLVHNVESGDLCGDATTPSEMTACLLEGGTLLRSVSDATCAALKVSAAECEEVHRQAEALLGRFGLGGGGRFGALVIQGSSRSPRERAANIV